MNDSRPCHCGKAFPAVPYDLTQCRLCWLYWNHGDYNRAFDLPPQATGPAARVVRRRHGPCRGCPQERGPPAVPCRDCGKAAAATNAAAAQLADNAALGEVLDHSVRGEDRGEGRGGEG